VYDDDELRAISNVVCKFTNVYVLSDEVYSMFAPKLLSIAEFAPHRSIILDSLSERSSAIGWKLGVLAFPLDLESLSRATAVHAFNIWGSTNTPVQFAAIESFAPSDACRVYVSNCAQRLAIIQARAFRILHDAGFEAGSPTGAYYITVRVADFDVTDKDFEREGVAIVSGSVFGLPEDAAADAPLECIRIACVDFDGAASLRVNPRLKWFEEIVAPRILLGINAIIRVCQDGLRRKEDTRVDQRRSKSAIRQRARDGVCSVDDDADGVGITTFERETTIGRESRREAAREGLEALSTVASSSGAGMPPRTRAQSMTMSRKTTSTATSTTSTTVTPLTEDP